MTCTIDFLCHSIRQKIKGHKFVQVACVRLDNPMVDFTTNINKPEIIEILSLLVETLFDIDNLPSIKAYPKSPTGFTYTCISWRVVWMYWTRFWPLRPEFEPRDRPPTPINDTFIQTSVPTRDIKIKWHDWFVDRCEVNWVQLMHWTCRCQGV